MSVRTPSRERSIGKAVLRDALTAEALAAFAECDGRSIPNAAEYAAVLLLRERGFIAWDPTARAEVPGPALLAARGAPVDSRGRLLAFRGRGARA